MGAIQGHLAQSLSPGCPACPACHAYVGLASRDFMGISLGVTANLPELAKLMVAAIGLLSYQRLLVVYYHISQVQAASRPHSFRFLMPYFGRGLQHKFIFFRAFKTVQSASVDIPEIDATHRPEKTGI
jgi:hypothetical protein